MNPLPTNAPRTFPAVDHAPDAIAAAKAGRTISMCIPCRNEAATIGALVAATRRELLDAHPVLDELIVLDDRSSDATAAAAADAGATVVPIARVHDRYGPADGKGNALWACLAASHGDLVVFCDGDVHSYRPQWILRLLAPLLADDELVLVKADYHRPTDAGGGGRTTELVARPALSLLAPGLTALAQPLAGEFAGRRAALEAIPFACGWGAEVAMLLDLAERHGAAALGQVDLGERRHRHQPLSTLAVQAAEVLATVLQRTGHGPLPDHLRRADGTSVELNLAERPPLRAARRA